MARLRKAVGHLKCLCCAEKVAVRESVNGLTVAACPFCGIQVQAHGEDSDEWLRGLAGAERKQTTEPERRSYEGQAKVYEATDKAGEPPKKTRSRQVRAPALWPFSEVVGDE